VSGGCHHVGVTGVSGVSVIVSPLRVATTNCTQSQLRSLLSVSSSSLYTSNSEPLQFSYHLRSGSSHDARLTAASWRCLQGGSYPCARLDLHQAPDTLNSTLLIDMGITYLPNYFSCQPQSRAFVPPGHPLHYFMFRISVLLELQPV